MFHERVSGVVGAGNYTYYTLSKHGSVTILLHPVSGDPDLYVSERNVQPTFDLDNHCLQVSWLHRHKMFLNKSQLTFTRVWQRQWPAPFEAANAIDKRKQNPGDKAFFSELGSLHTPEQTNQSLYFISRGEKRRSDRRVHFVLFGGAVFFRVKWENNWGQGDRATS